MKILVIGSTGTIGKEIYKSLQQHHEVYGAHRNSSSFPVDISNKESIESLFNKLPKLDAVINASGTASWKSLSDLKEEDYYIGIKSKLMGQVNLVHVAKNHLNDYGSITLTTGILAEHYEPNAVALSLVNGAIHSYVNTASKELDRGIRLNTVAPGAISSDFPKDKKFAGYFPVDIKDVVKIYEYSLTTNNTGQILKIY
ncbi:NAD(P)-dependent dehydrogenase, short-chain alcohol dehydrogenase family [Aquimarina amphilecti]|uniref:NAD(P)-dependent dehydrogenase, short-chain alcohol dehydrogenase family n=1 Tax=Aquimarina amphilecti TaxID=1038014 RepID=A0A1H7GQ88_AQUAM|nr:short chain dehydrogenase [Aquimarina amphilecti]SEK40241.1 NAD(P)-dependent dehydrogenase, short-chain alcohol dehydrogenase family [Aquimarina amphilecti]